MTLDKLIERIGEDARKEADRITGEAREQAEEILKNAESEAEQIYRRKLDAARAEAENERKQRKAMAGLDARKSILEEKQRLLNEVFDKALQGIVDMPRDRYLGLLVKLVVDATGSDGGELFLSERDRDQLGGEIVSRANRLLEESGAGGRITLSEETREMSGGFVLSTHGIEVNSSLESLIESRREQLESTVVGILFGEDG